MQKKINTVKPASSFFQWTFGLHFILTVDVQIVCRGFSLSLTSSLSMTYTSVDGGSVMFGHKTTEAKVFPSPFAPHLRQTFLFAHSSHFFWESFSSALNESISPLETFSISANYSILIYTSRINSGIILNYCSFHKPQPNFHLHIKHNWKIIIIIINMERYCTKWNNFSCFRPSPPCVAVVVVFFSASLVKSGSTTLFRSIPESREFRFPSSWVILSVVLPLRRPYFIDL